MKERLKKLRKTLNLTQAAFAEKIGAKQNTIATYEMGRNNPSDPVIRSICIAFNVNEQWLKTGKGEMFLPETNGELEALAKKYSLSHGAQVVVEKFVNMNETEQQVILNYCTEIANALAVDTTPVTTKTKSFPKKELNNLTIDEMVEDYRRQLEAEEKATAKSSALQKNA